MAITLDDREKHATECLENLMAVLSGRTKHDLAQYQVNGQLVTKMGRQELEGWVKHYNGELMRIKETKRRRAGKTTGRFLTAVICVFLLVGCNSGHIKVTADVICAAINAAGGVQSYQTWGTRDTIGRVSRFITLNDGSTVEITGPAAEKIENE